MFFSSCKNRGHKNTHVSFILVVVTTIVLGLKTLHCPWVVGVSRWKMSFLLKKLPLKNVKLWNMEAPFRIEREGSVRGSGPFLNDMNFQEWRYSWLRTELISHTLSLLYFSDLYVDPGGSNFIPSQKKDNSWLIGCLGSPWFGFLGSCYERDWDS